MKFWETFKVIRVWKKYVTTSFLKGGSKTPQLGLIFYAKELNFYGYMACKKDDATPTFHCFFSTSVVNGKSKSSYQQLLPRIWHFSLENQIRKFMEKIPGKDGRSHDWLQKWLDLRKITEEYKKAFWTRLSKFRQE